MEQDKTIQRMRDLSEVFSDRVARDHDYSQVSTDGLVYAITYAVKRGYYRTAEGCLEELERRKPGV